MFQPIHNYVLLERLNEGEKTAGGIIIPDTAKEKPVRGKVIAVGNGEYQDGDLIPMSIKVGDIVMFTKWASSSSEIKIDGKDYIIIKENEILGILK